MNYLLFSFAFLLIVCKSQASQLVSLSSQCSKDFANEILAYHNTYRARHGVASLAYNLDIEKTAQKYADFLAQNDLFQHSHTDGLGENLASSWSSNKPNTAHCSNFGKSFTNMWYNEISLYNFSNPGFSMGTGHFTQVIWKTTTEMGCGLSVSSANKVYGVCNYAPQGNFIGEFEENVLPLSSN